MKKGVTSLIGLVTSRRGEKQYSLFDWTWHKEVSQLERSKTEETRMDSAIILLK